jgi:hypothetical protein
VYYSLIKVKSRHDNLTKSHATIDTYGFLTKIYFIKINKNKL